MTKDRKEQEIATAIKWQSTLNRILKSKHMTIINIKIFCLNSKCLERKMRFLNDTRRGQDVQKVHTKTTKHLFFSKKKRRRSCSLVVVKMK
jgi:hypothetical protein